jgi:hypothetical protein
MKILFAFAVGFAAIVLFCFFVKIVGILFDIMNGDES